MDLEVLWEENSELIGNTIDDLDYWAGRVAMTKSDFMEAVKELNRPPLIAVFTRYQADFDRLRCYPKENYKNILNVKDVKGVEFTGTMAVDDFYENDKVREAYEELLYRQPKIFKK